MRRPLGKHFDERSVCNGIGKLKGLMVMAFLFLSFNLSYAQTFSRIECQCLNNSTTDDDGQFGETITINSASGETWTVVTSTDLYDVTSPAPPAAPVPLADGTNIPEGLPGQYILDAKRINNTNWSLEVTNGAVTIPITSQFLCQYPSEEIIGDFGTCIETIETYEVELPDSQIGSITWSVSGGGNIVGGQGTRRIFVDWGDVVGDYDVSFMGTAGSYDGQMNDICDFSGTRSVGVMDEEAFALACNNQVNISLNGNCDLDITADMILEDMLFTNDSYDLIITDIEADTVVPGPTLGMEYIDRLLQVSVVHECSGNSCWGNILLEDKSIPQLICENDTIDCNEFMGPEVIGFPVPDDVTITALGDDMYLLENFDKCSDAYLRFEDTPVTSNLCTGPFSSIIERSWLVEDNSGNTASCVEMIYVNRADLLDITFPPSYDDVLGPNPSLEACGNWPKLPNGNPDPEFTGFPEGIFCLNVKVDYEDTVLPKCGDESYKLRRRWVVQDLCDGTFLPPYTQNITVLDRIDPVCTAPPFFTVGSTETSCSSLIEVPAPTITDCSETSYTVSWNPCVPGVDPFFQPSNDGVVQHSDGSFLLSEVPDGVKELWILYYATDACDNTSTCFTKVTIVDDVQPIPVCDLHTFVGLNEDGIGYASIESFDDGSWDNCEIDYMEVRRMENFACGESVQWGEKVKFCCDDVGSIVMVQLRVVDKAGNSNFCMVEAEVQDNHDPMITFCPADITIDCEDDIVNLEQYGMAEAEDNCNVTVTSTEQYNLNECGTGVITRTFRAEDDQGNFVTCQQRIRVLSLDPFYINPNNPNDPSDDIVWPGNHTIANGCASTGVHPDDLPAGKQRPVILRESCSQIGFTYDDVVFQYTDEACSKILRTWKVIDHCVFIPVTNAGLWTYTQVIKVENSTKPVIENGCQQADYTITQLSNCSARIQGEAMATDDCTPTDELKFSYRFDEDNDGSIDFSAESSSINRVVDFGNHRVIWEVEDECGNIETCAVVISVQDDKAPTPYCYSEIVTVVMENSGSVEIWASDFDNGSFDNCADQDELIASFSTNTNNTSMEFTCDDLDGESTSFELNIYITDPSGNQDFCTATLVVQDNQNHCGDDVNNGGNDEDRVALGGQIFNDENENLAGVNVTLNATLPEFPLVAETDADGGYTFNDLLAEEDYSIEPSLDANYNDGVSTLDLVLIQQHLLGINSFDNPYKVIAADINNSESITASDLLQLRKLILGIYSELPSNTSWRFVDAAYEFAEPNNPFPFNEELDMNLMTEDYMDANFVAVKVGDVNNSASFNVSGKLESTVRSSKTMIVEDQYLEAGLHSVAIDLDLDEEWYGMQFAFNINESLIADAAIESDVFLVTEGNYRLDKKLYVSIHESISVSSTKEVLTLELDVKKAGYLSEMIGLANDKFSNEIYVAGNDASILTSDLNLEINNRSFESSNDFELLQNVPNPFTSTTDIGFVLPAKENVTLRVMDVTGKLLVTRRGTFNKGLNTITLDVSEIDGSGILYYQLDTESNSASKKMIIIK